MDEIIKVNMTNVNEYWPFLSSFFSLKLVKTLKLIKNFQKILFFYIFKGQADFNRPVGSGGVGYLPFLHLVK